MKKKLLIVATFLSLSSACKAEYNKTSYDLTLVGLAQFADGLGRLSISIMDCLKDKLSINFISTHKRSSKKDIPEDILNIINNPDKAPGRVALLTFQPWSRSAMYVDAMPESPIKIAYSMLEGTRIPAQWVTIFNKQFDAVVVPDNYYVDVYKKSGVQIPIFVIPCPLYLDDFLKTTPKINKDYYKKVFTFGCSANFIPAKNFTLLIKAFAQSFGNNPNFKLVLHGRYAHQETLQEIYNLIHFYKLDNVEVVKKMISQEEYINFLDNIDAYVLFSKGEGFSITPREALARGIPCIISNNTAHKTICNTGFVRPVNSYIKTPAVYSNLTGKCGYNFDSNLQDACDALKEVYQHYHIYKKRALSGRQWVKQYRHKNLKARYYTLIKPRKVILADANIITDDCLVTNSRILYEKYQANILGATYEVQ